MASLEKSYMMLIVESEPVKLVYSSNVYVFWFFENTELDSWKSEDRASVKGHPGKNVPWIIPPTWKTFFSLLFPNWESISWNGAIYTKETKKQQNINT